MFDYLQSLVETVRNTTGPAAATAVSKIFDLITFAKGEDYYLYGCLAKKQAL